jgi:hypothetical protein
MKALVYDSVDFVWRDGLVTAYDAESMLHKVVVHQDVDDASNLKAGGGVTMEGGGADDDLKPAESASECPLTEADEHAADLKDLKESFRSKTAHDMPDLLPPSILMRIERRERKRQREDALSKVGGESV